MRYAVFLAFLLLGCWTAVAENVFPGAEWERRNPDSLGMDGGLLDRIAEQLGGRGCVVKNGYVVKTWGNQTRVGDWASSAKPVLSTLLFFALQEGRVKSVDQPIAEFGWALVPKDRGITFRHLGSMSSGYARPEAAGKAWSYNDYAIQLYQKTLFDKVFQGDAKTIAEAPARFGALGLQDGLQFTDRRRLSASVRDFARIVWFWVNRGQWADKTLLPKAYFDEYMKPQTSKDLPITAHNGLDEDYLQIGSYGGTSDHFSEEGPGVYGFNWWFNETGGTHPDRLTWPDAPKDTIMTLGVRGNSSAFIPSLNIALVCAEGDWNASDKNNQVLALLAQACRPAPAAATVTGGLHQWGTVTLSFSGPELSESGTTNPFLDYRLQVQFTRKGRSITVPGYYAADGNAGESGADAGSVWRAHFVPDEPGQWEYFAEFQTGPKLAASEKPGTPTGFDGAHGTIEVAKTPANQPGFLGKGLLRAMGNRYFQFSGTGEYFLKGGADSPENLLAFADFDGTTPTHTLTPHVRDWKPGDPVWRDGKGKGLIGALNYLAAQGMNSVYFITMTAEGDGKDVWPWTDAGERYRFDCSKLDQWEVVFTHMDRLGLLLHLVGQEQENDQLLDGGRLSVQRKLYYRELIARFGHHRALVWNLGEENTNTAEQRRSFADYIKGIDPYQHPVLCHTFPKQYDLVYRPLLGAPTFDGPSLQMGDMKKTHDETLKWVRDSWRAGRQWVVCLDEIGPPSIGVKPDTEDPAHDEVRRHALWGNLMAGGAGCEWFFQSDIHCEDWRSRENMWAQTKVALDFFHAYLPFWEMTPCVECVRGEGVWCLARPGEQYVVYLPAGQAAEISTPAGKYRVQWFNPRTGGALQLGKRLHGGVWRALGAPPARDGEDWVALVEKVR